MEDILPFFGVPIMIIAFMLVFIVVIPRLGGWRKLSQKYVTTKKANAIMGERIHFGEINIGGLKLQNMVQGYKTNQGLFLTQYLFFQNQPPNILIPWEEFQPAEERKILFFRRYRIPVGDPQVSYLEMSARNYERIADRLP